VTVTATARGGARGRQEREAAMEEEIRAKTAALVAIYQQDILTYFDIYSALFGLGGAAAGGGGGGGGGGGVAALEEA
jgi:hypothetical protein